MKRVGSKIMLIHSINIGQPQLRLRNGSEVLTAGDKLPVASANLHTLGFAGDGQADKANHGGPDQAVCVYPLITTSIGSRCSDASWRRGPLGKPHRARG